MGYLITRARAFVKVLGFSAADTLVAATKLGGEIMGKPGSWAS